MRARMKRLALVAAAVLVAVGLFVLVVHTPPVRRPVLRYAGRRGSAALRHPHRCRASRLQLAGADLGLVEVRSPPSGRRTHPSSKLATFASRWPRER